MRTRQETSLTPNELHFHSHTALRCQRTYVPDSTGTKTPTKTKQFPPAKNTTKKIPVL